MKYDNIEYFNKVKSLCHEISELDPTAAIFEIRIKKLLFMVWGPSLVALLQQSKGWLT